ncbi:CPBP family intramembrane glutamic endopeptidase [Microbacteriaceae bacterium 4G12]
MNKRYWWVIVTYILMQLSSIVGLPLLLKTGWYNKYSPDVRLEVVVGHWSIISFFAALLIILLLLRDDIRNRHLERDRASIPSTILWCIVGIIMAWFAQGVATSIEMTLFRIKADSENTKRLIEIATMTPWFILVTSILAPILEEIVFRKILFGALYKRFNFFIAAIVSSLVFAAAHFDFSHLLVYISMGLVFSFLYVKTKRIIVPIMAHVMMNTIVVLLNFVFREELERMMHEADKLQSFIGGF